MRGVPRWLAVLAVVAVAVGVCAFAVARAMRPAVFLAQLSDSAIPADGFSSTELRLSSPSGRELHAAHIEIAPQHHLALDSLTVHDNTVIASLTAGVLPGDATLKISALGFSPREIKLQVTPDFADSVGDGTPDFLRLHDPSDRRAFRQWFTLLAEWQYFRTTPPPAEIDDCAALLRFAYREALREHDAVWARDMGMSASANAIGVRQYQYPYTPLQAAVFRVRDGRFVAGNLRDGSFAEFADAQALWRHNTYFVGRDVARARPGDLLFFRQDAGRMPFHAMIFLGPSQMEPTGQEFVVYHTGPNGSLPGEIRRLSIAQLASYPDPRWRPTATNPVFLGVYRWNILRGPE